jgi:hypothetical protein
VRLYDAGVRIGLGTDTGGVPGGRFFGLDSHVELELVLDANPLDDIANTRRINRVYLRGEEIPRTALLAKWNARG